ncbi:MAG: hypothetical protein HGA38_00270 [Candidatus Moranbacteria bacterium]|nr:hypothetical protein [Candidatus Moranbacteria bacterium]NTW45971.1 hypothetical protein [Candidatus Moranbacteria bacterium]
MIIKDINDGATAFWSFLKKLFVAVLLAEFVVVCLAAAIKSGKIAFVAYVAYAVIEGIDPFLPVSSFPLVGGFFLLAGVACLIVAILAVVKAVKIIFGRDSTGD